jgi:uncharacterized protein
MAEGFGPLVKKRWRAWLRALHRDFGYLAIGFTVIYAISGIAQNHIEDWGEVSYRTYEQTKTIAAIPDDLDDAEAVARVAALVDFGKPSTSFRAGDEVRLDYAGGSKVTVIGTTATIQGRERRAFIGVANWLHTARNKSGWRYVADVYALMLLYLAISGIFMIKGRLGLKWRGALLITVGVAVPVTAVLVSGPDARKATPATATAPAEPTSADDNGIKFLPTEPETTPSSPDSMPSQMPVLKQPPPPDAGDVGGAGSGSGSAKCDPFSSMHGCGK